MSDADLLSATELAGRLGLPPPTAEQAAVIEAPLAPCVVIAGAGSGKTETMATRVVWLVANRMVRPDEVLGLTFTRKAAAELGRRIRRRLAQWRGLLERERPDEIERLAELTAGEPSVLTYAAYAGRLVGEHAARLGAEPAARVLSPAVAWQIADEVSRRYTGDLPRDIGAPSSVPKWLIAMAAQFADHLADADTVERYCVELDDWFHALAPGRGARSEYPNKTGGLIESLRHRRALLPLVRAFAAAKTARGAVDFGDQMTLAARLAGLPEVVAAERSLYRAVLLDEYQDTGHAQVETLRGLFGEGQAVTAVGDPFQSIYGWRGASAGNIGRFSTSFPDAVGEPARVFPLATSFRNDRAILRAANVVSAPLRTDPTTIELRAAPGAADGTVRVARTRTVEDEAAWVAQEVRTHWDALPVGDRTAAVLVRRRSQIPLLHEALRGAGLPVEVVGLGGLLTTPEVVDVVATLRVLVRYDSGTSLARLLTGARWRIGARDLAALRDRAAFLVRPLPGAAPELAAAADTLSLTEALDDLGHPSAYSPAGHARLTRFATELRGLRRRISAPLGELVAEVERTIGIDIEAAARPERAGTGRVHLDRFLDVAAEFSAESDDPTLTAFLAFLDAAEEEENGLEAGEIVVDLERVQVLTVHGAKGLEWDIVAVPGLVEQVFPSDPRSINWTRARQELPGPLRGDRADLPTLALREAADRKAVRDATEAYAVALKDRHALEERRLAYVALTRARSALLTSGYVWDTTTSPRRCSPFLLEIRTALDPPDTEPTDWYEPEPDESNPILEQARVARWPVDPLGPFPGDEGPGRRPSVEAAAALVRAAGERLPIALSPAAQVWHDDVDRLLAERAALARGDAIEVTLPPRLSVSQLVVLDRDPAELARSLRRPLPRRPAPAARRGTEFHRWLEQRWGAQALLDVDQLPGSADADASDEQFELLRKAFLDSEWAARTPVEVEVPFEMTLGVPAGPDLVVRGRMDAVFADGDPAEVPRRWIVVDWKTGAVPTGAAAEAAAVQLAAYRLAWVRLCGLADDEVHRVRAAFHYVAHNRTVEPARLWGADELGRLLARST